MQVIFKQVEDFVDYEINNLGNIYSLERFVNWKGKFKVKINSCKLGLRLNTKGYPHVVLYKNGKAYTFRVHRLVAETFIDNPDNKPEVNHKDGNKLNNRVDNLEWVTDKENYDHAVKNGLKSKEWFYYMGKVNKLKKIT